MNEALDFGIGDSQYVFTDLELNELLGVIERKAAGEAEPDALDFLRATDGNGLALQFQPRSQKDNGSGCSLEQSAVAAAVKLEDSALSSALASPVDTPALTSVADPASLYGSGAEISIMPMPHAAAASAPTSLHAYTLPGTAGHAALVGSSPALVSTLVAAATAAQQAQHNAQLAAAAAGCLHVHAPLQLARFASVPAPPGKAMTMSMSMAEPKGQISHSTVEKQRRDRINSLIDELRELVPPQQRGGANGAAAAAANDAGGLEARRPKHVVLADTIQLLKHLQLKLSMGALEVGGATNGCYVNGNGGYCNGGGGGGSGGAVGRLGSGFNGEEDTANSEGKASKGSSSHEEMEVGGAPQMPHIPCQMTQMSGVTVERGPDCYYVQVKCRDRKGLLSDIINALRQLPLEIRTAAVTTTNGTVRDVFEVKLDDPGLSPEDVQNLVHDALFQSHLLAAQSESLAAAGKRPRA